MSFWVWLLLGGSVAYWGLQLFARPLAMPALVVSAGDGQAGSVDLSRLLGSGVPEAAKVAWQGAVRNRPDSDAGKAAAAALAALEEDMVKATPQPAKPTPQ